MSSTSPNEPKSDPPTPSSPTPPTPPSTTGGSVTLSWRDNLKPESARVCSGQEAEFWHQVEVLAFVRRTQQSSESYCKDTIVEQFVGQPLDLTKNYLMIHLEGSHIYVIIVYQNQIYLCDGPNKCLETYDMRDKFAKRFSVPEVQCIRYDRQTCDTHCTNSAVLIMIELLKLFKRKVETLPQVLQVPRYMREKLVNRIHKKEYKRPHLRQRPPTKD